MCRIALIVLLFGQTWSQFRGPPMVETKPNLLDSFIPASMQIIAYMTEIMKFELKPQTGDPTTTTTSTVPPTRPHKPAIYAPQFPPGPSVYFSKGFTYEEYVDRLKHPSGYNYFDRYKFSLEQQEERGRSLDSTRYYSEFYREIPEDIEDLIGKQTSDLLKLGNTIEEISERDDNEQQIQEFSRSYDDSNFGFLLLRQKKTPPTRAYVTLLSLYNLLNKESKSLGLNKYSGYSQNILVQLAETSSGTSADQLKTVLTEITRRKDTKNAPVLKKIDQLVKDLEDTSSYLNTALRYIPPLKFAL